MNFENERLATRLVVSEGQLLDSRDWDGWLDLYLTNAEYWIPCWRDELDSTDDPKTELSMIYYSERAGLEDRVYRIKTGRSLASTPLPRTCHIITPTSFNDIGNSFFEVKSNWATFSYKNGTEHYFFGSQIHTLFLDNDKMKIAKRKVLVMNEIIPNVLDIYSV